MVSQGIALGKSAQELLGEFVQTGRQEPFEEIVRRYAGMVFNVCYQILRDSHDAEDATQAVFLTLAVKSKTEVGIKYLAPWLQKVAQRLALDVKRSKTRRKVREERHTFMQRYSETEQDASREVDLDEVKVVLRDELDKLPAKYRLPLILHYFGGLKPEEMARELGCKPSTLGVRLHRGRKLLADSLAGRGIVVNGSILGLALATIVQCSVSDHLIRQTSHAAMQMVSGNTVGAGMSAQVMGYNRLATHGLFMMRLKSVVTAAVLIASAAAGAAEFVGKVKPLGLHFDLSNQIRSIFGSVVKSFTSPIKVSSTGTQQPSVQTVAMAASEVADANVKSSDEAKSAVATNQTAAPVESATVVATNDTKASDLTASTGAPSSVAAIASLPTFTIPQPTVRWPAATPSKTPVALETSTATAKVDAVPPPAQAMFASGQSITVGGAAGTNQRFTWSNPAPLSVPKITVGVDGIGALAIAGNAQVKADKIDIGQDKGSDGSLDVSDHASVASNSLTVGDKGTGQVDQHDATTVVAANQIIIGADGKGTYNLYDGTLKDKTIVIGLRGDGTFNQVDGQHEVKITPTSDGGLRVAQAPGSTGVYELRAGKLKSGNEDIGMDGAATFKETNGSNTTGLVTIGVNDGGNGIYKLPGGRLKIALSSNSFNSGVIVGEHGTGALILGSPTGTGRIYETGTGAPASMVVRDDASATGRVEGFGSVRLKGPLLENGQIIADGYGKDRDLNLSSFASIANTIDNDPGQSNGWFARHGGRLILPAMNVTAPISVNTWGEDPSDDQIDLINSVHFRFSGVQTAGQYHVDLLAPDRPDVPTAPAGVQFASVWSTDVENSGANSIAMTLRYDDTFSPGIAAGQVQLWTYQDGWQDVGDAAQTDVADRLITATVAPMEYFAISTISTNAVFPQPLDPVTPSSLGVLTPEPSSLSLLAISATALLRRRRRDSSVK